MKSLFSMNYLEIINNIMDYYYSKFSAGYIPALYNENKIYIDGEELYCKLVIAPKEYEVKKTWIKDNLSNIIDESHIHNILVEYNYKFNKIYGLSPYLLSDDNVIIEDPLTFANILDSASWEKVQIGGKTAIYGEFVSNVKYKCKISK